VFAVADEVVQDVEYLRLNRNERARATQLSSIAVQGTILEQIQQITWPAPRSFKIATASAKAKSSRSESKIKGFCCCSPSYDRAFLPQKRDQPSLLRP